MAARTGWLHSMCGISGRPARDSGSRRRRLPRRGRRLWGPMRRNNVALRLQESLLEEARKVSESEGVALNQFINVAVAEKLSALRTEDYFRERAERADVGLAKAILKRAGKRKRPVAGDEIAG